MLDGMLDGMFGALQEERLRLEAAQQARRSQAFSAARDGEVDVLRELITAQHVAANGPERLGCDRPSETMLHIASAAGSVPTCELLLVHRANCSAIDAQGLFALHQAEPVD